MSAPPFMQLYVSDYLGDTLHLTTEQHGAYMLLLLAMWNGGGDLPADPKFLCRVTRCTPSRWARIGADVLSFFTVESGRLTNARLGLELKKAQEKSIQRAVLGSQGGKAKALKDNNPHLAKASGLLQHLPEPEPDKELEATPLVAKATPAEFEEAWKAYPHVKGRSSKKLALAEWRRMPPPDRPRLALACRRYASEGREPKGDCGAPAMERWLKRGLHQEWWGDGGNIVSISPEWLAERARLAETAEAS